MSRASAQPYTVADPVAPIVAVLAQDDGTMAEAVANLEQSVSNVRPKSAAYTRDYGSYYNRDMRTSLVRRFLGLDFLIPEENRVQLKAGTTGIESQLRVALGEAGVV